MYIVAQDGSTIVHSDYPIKVVNAADIEFVSTDPAAYASYLVVSILDYDDVEILGQYDTKEAGITVLKDIVRALGKGVVTYQMPSTHRLNAMLQKEAYGVTVSIN